MVGAAMKHDPYGDHFAASTNELICTVLARVDASDCLHSLLALMVEESSELSSSKQWRMACSLRDVAAVIEERPAVRAWIELALALTNERATTP
jgi:hypothetical protein